jgi:hypothetical protein
MAAPIFAIGSAIVDIFTSKRREIFATLNATTRIHAMQMMEVSRNTRPPVGFLRQ